MHFGALKNRIRFRVISGRGLFQFSMIRIQRPVRQLTAVIWLSICIFHRMPADGIDLDRLSQMNRLFLSQLPNARHC